MWWLWTILIVLVVLYLLFRLFIWFFANWRRVLNSVITQFIAVSMEFPDKDVAFWYAYTVEIRYPLVLSGAQRVLYDRKEQLQASVFEILCSEDETPAHILLNKTTLPSLILFCLIVEGNRFVRHQSRLQRAYLQIEYEVKRQGFEEFC